MADYHQMWKDLGMDVDNHDVRRRWTTLISYWQRFTAFVRQSW